VGPQQFVFDEAQKIANLKFEFLEKGNSTQYCVKLASRMPKFETKEMDYLIKGQYVYEHFDQEKIKLIGAMLADPKNTFTLLLSKSFKEEELGQLEPWYNIKFHSEKYPEALHALMLHPTVKDNGKKLDLPPENKLIPTKFDLHPENKDHSAQPVFASLWEDTDLWFKKDDRFHKPKGHVAAKIYTNDLSYGSASLTRVFAEVWKGCLTEYMREFKYMADCAMLNLEITLPTDNIQFHWSGFSDTLPAYVHETLKRVLAMRTADLESIFNQVKEQMLQEIKNFYLNQTFRLAAAYLDIVILD
jgi:secreted Zn-dependent insulinase-like peptidase